ncbi:fimbrillin family protein [Bacteroides fragilis]|uniref:fimbrillin family protein n=1 Tax=Bacteroides fragilis TaxID=817 RepID=UPI002030B72A|nr:fimbrillin family protein [Bacteroides fragilis]MCM0298271.1 fimbrillin family protein [Bacteroides fragilis]
MKAFGYVLLACLACTLFSCGPDELLPEPVPPVVKPGDDDKPDEKPEEPAKVQLGITAALQNMQQTRGIIEAFAPGHEMGIFVSTNQGDEATGTKNASYLFDGKVWNAGQDVPVEADADVVAYLPYDKGVTDFKNVPFDLVDQNDILYGTAKVTKDVPTANLVMQHAMTLVRVRLMKNEYMGTGLVSDMTFSGVYTSGTVDALAGTVTKDYNHGRGSVKVGGNYMLNDENPVTVDAIMIPRSSYEEQAASVSFVIDGQKHTYTFPIQHEWKAGMKYTYTLKMTGNYNAPVNKEQVDIDVDYWSQYGKTDDIILNPNPEDYEFTIWTNYTAYGYDCYQNEGKVFGTFYYPWCGTSEGEMRFVFMKEGTNEIVEKFQPINIKTNGAWDGKRIQCYVTSAPGTYQLVPLFRKKGETMWCRAAGYDYGSTDREWLYEVKAPAPDNLPALRDVELEGQDNTTFLSYRIPFDQSFNVVFTLSNKGEKALRGKIKAVWEREFKLKSNSYRPSTKKKEAINDNEWNDEIGIVSVDIPTGTRFWKGIMGCKVTQYYPMPHVGGVEYAGPIIHLYWQPEGETEWTLLRLDADYLFNNNYTGNDIWDETLNYINVSLAEWYN